MKVAKSVLFVVLFLSSPQKSLAMISNQGNGTAGCIGHVVDRAVEATRSNTDTESDSVLEFTCDTFGNDILASLSRLGRCELKEYLKENNFVVDSSIESLFKNDEEQQYSRDLSLLEKARNHPKLRLAPQQQLRNAGQEYAMGLFANEFIAKGQPIIEHVGQTKVLFQSLAEAAKLVGWLPSHLSEDEAQQRSYNLGFEQEDLSQQLFLRAKTYALSNSDFVTAYVCIDSEKRGNAARFANHSVKWANAEIMIVVEIIDGKPLLHPLLVASRDIDVHEEILWNYGKDNGYFELQGKQLRPEYRIEEIAEFLKNADRYSELNACLSFHGEMASAEAKKILVEPGSYLLRRKDSRLFFCVLAKDCSQDENFEPVDRTEYVEFEFWIINGQYTFEPKSDPNNNYGKYFDKLYELRNAAKIRLSNGDSLTLSKKKGVRRSVTRK